MIIFLVGYYGLGNIGDEICLSKSKAYLRMTYPDAKFLTLGSDQVPRFSFFALTSAIKQANIMVFGGGGLLQNSTSSRSLYYYLFLIILAALFSTPVILLSQGIGPIKGRVSKFFLKAVLKRVSSITVRDQASADYIEGIPVKITADLAFYQAKLIKNEHSDLRSIAVNFCLKQYYQKQKQLLDYVRNLNYPIQFLDLFQGQDNALIMQLANENEKIVPLNENNFYTSTDVQVSMCITMRYHSCIWAGLRGIPFIALAYDPKVYNIATQLGQPVIKLYDKQDLFPAFTDYMNEFQTNYDRYKQTVIQRVQELITKVEDQ